MSLVRAEVADGRQVGVLTRDDIADALREYARRYGDDFAQSAFSPASAKRNGRPDLVERYYAGREDGRPWPSLNAIKSKQPNGTFNEARASIGLPPNTTGPARGRRAAGEAEPILTVRERLVYVPDEKNKQLRDRINRLEARLLDAQRSRDRWRDEVRALKARPVERVVREVTRPEVRTKVKTVTKVKKVRDERALERLRGRLADSEARARALDDQLRSERRDRNRAESRFQALEAELVSARESVREAERERDRATDRLVAVEALMKRLRGEIEEARAESVGAREAAAVSDLVRHAEDRAERAEVRAARAEREMAEQAAAITGEMRKLTASELAELRAKGPAGEVVFGRALRKFARARAVGGREPLREAIAEVIRAGATWLDRL